MENIFNKKNMTTFLAAILLLAFLPACGDAAAVDFDPFRPRETNKPFLPKEFISEGPVIPQIAFTNNDISMAFQIISDATGWSIFPTAEVSRAKISLWAKDITAKELLDRVVTLAGFIYHRRGGIITVMTYNEYTQYYGLAKKAVPLIYADATSVAAVIKPFLSRLGKSVVHKETNTIVLYETDANLEFVARTIEKLDSPAEDIVVEVVDLRYADCESLATMLKGVFGTQKKTVKNKSSGDSDASKPAGTKDGQHPEYENMKEVLLPCEPVEIYSVNHVNQLVIVGTKPDVEKVKAVIAMIDVYSDNMVLEVIDLKYADAEMLAEILQKVFSSNESKKYIKNIQQEKKPPNNPSQGKVEAKAKIKGVLSTPQAYTEVYSVGRTNQLIIKVTRGDIENLKKLIEKLDTYIEPTTRNYHFIYVDATEIYRGLEQVLDISGRFDERNRQRRGRRSGITLVEKTNSILLTGPPSVHRIMTSIAESIDVPTTYEAGVIRIYKLENADLEEVANAIRELLQSKDKQQEKASEVKFLKKPSSDESETPPSGDLAKTEEFIPRVETRVTVSKSTNSVIVRATARQHRELEKLIKELDKRRKQVLIEAMIIEVVTSDSLDVGVELSHVGESILAFTSFGLSKIDPVSGARDIIVGPGGTAAVLEPEKVQAILQAVQSNANARITSAPQILVNDNAVGFINSVAEEPITQINASETVATTSFAGFVEAGTQFAITPHISESNYLRIEYEITLNSFGTRSTDVSIPPPRSTTSIRSEATVPDGFTIVVGGLQNSDESESVDKVPLLGDIPLIGFAFQKTSVRKQYKTTYLFITPSIMKGEDFSDLKEVSREVRQEMESDVHNRATYGAKTKDTE